MALDLSALDATASSVPHGQVALPGTPARAPLSRFEEDPDNPRFEHDAAAFEALVSDIAQRGILQPIVVRAQPGGVLRIRFGARRYRAALQLGLTDAPYVTTDDERQFDDYAQVAENARRAPLQPLEMATFVAKKLAQGERRRAIAARLQMDPSAMTHLLALVDDAPGWLLELYHGQRCRTPQYLYGLRRLALAHPELVAERCAKASEIDRNFMERLAAECAAAAAPSAGAGAALAQAGTVGSDPASGAAKAQVATIPVPDAPAAEQRKWPPLVKPKLLGRVGKRQVQLALHLRASAPDKTVVLFDDGSVDEVALSSISLTSLEGARG
ncbi:MAG: ParB/RepB/Spo0J family partition protein [Pseudomonadota bacterium]